MLFDIRYLVRIRALSEIRTLLRHSYNNVVRSENGFKRQMNKKKIGLVRVGLAQEGVRTIVYTFQASTCRRCQYRAKREKKPCLLYRNRLKYLFYSVF